jgi:hypothetical protein
MKCRHCGDQVLCASCGAPAVHSQNIWARWRRQRGMCLRCPAALSAYDKRHGHVHCRPCRIAHADESRRRHALRGRKDRGGKVAA